MVVGGDQKIKGKVDYFIVQSDSLIQPERVMSMFGLNCSRLRSIKERSH